MTKLKLQSPFKWSHSALLQLTKNRWGQFLLSGGKNFHLWPIIRRFSVFRCCSKAFFGPPSSDKLYTRSSSKISRNLKLKANRKNRVRIPSAIVVALWRSVKSAWYWKDESSRRFFSWLMSFKTLAIEILKGCPGLGPNFGCF